MKLWYRIKFKLEDEFCKRACFSNRLIEWKLKFLFTDSIMIEEK